jgi:Ca2+-binding RTX toxin-like protein
MPLITTKLTDYAIINIAGFYIEGSDGDDALWGSSRADTIHGRNGNDALYGQDGNDNIFGEAGNDYFAGGAGNDAIDGGSGRDWLIGGAGADALTGGTGYDTASYASSTAVTVQLGYQGFGGEAQGDTYSGIENVYGSIFNDSLIGDAGNNILNGARGNDQLIGGAGRDFLIGGEGFDTLTGDSAGVYNNDTFIIVKSDNSYASDPSYHSHHTITDFQSGYDTIALSGYIAADFGSDGQLAHGILYEDGIIRFTDHLDASDKLYLDGNTLYECNIQMIDGEAHLISSQPVVTIEQEYGGGGQIYTDDFAFISGDPAQYASNLQFIAGAHFPTDVAIQTANVAADWHMT